MALKNPEEIYKLYKALQIKGVKPKVLYGKAEAYSDLSYLEPLHGHWEPLTSGASAPLSYLCPQGTCHTEPFLEAIPEDETLRPQSCLQHKQNCCLLGSYQGQPLQATFWPRWKAAQEPRATGTTQDP